MYDPRVLKPKRFRKRSKNIEGKKKACTGVNMNIEDEDRHEKSFYANLMKKRPLVSEPVKITETANKNKKGVTKADITYPYRPVEESVIPARDANVPESTPIKPEIARSTTIGTKIGANEIKPSIEPMFKLNQSVGNDDLFKKPEVKSMENKPFELKVSSGGMFDKKSTEAKKPDILFSNVQPVDNKSSLFNQTSNLFTDKHNNSKPVETAQQKIVTQASLFNINQPASSLLFNDTVKKPEEDTKEPLKAAPLFGSQTKSSYDNKQDDVKNPIISGNTTGMIASKITDEPKITPLFGGASGSMFNNTAPKPVDEQSKATPIAPLGQPTDNKLSGMLFNQITPQPNVIAPSPGGFKLDSNQGPGLFGNKPGDNAKPSFNFFNNTTTPNNDLKPKIESKPNNFEEEKEDKQNKPPTLFNISNAMTTQPTNIFNPNPANPLKSPFASPIATLPPNENPLANSQNNLFFNNNQSNSLFNQPNNNPSSPQPNNNENQPISQFNQQNSISNNQTNANARTANPFLSAPSPRLDNKLANSLNPGGKATNLLKSNTSSKNNDPLNQRLNDVIPAGPGAGSGSNGIAVGSFAMFNNPTQPLFGANPNQPINTQPFTSNVNANTGLFPNNGGLFNNNRQV